MSFIINTKNVFKKTKKVIGDIEKEALEEISEVSAFSKKAKAENDLFKNNTDANYFTVVTFNNSAQLDEFLNKIGLTPSDKQYIDGLALAKKLGIEITTPSRQAPGSFRVNQELIELIMDEPV
jgi:hypothetical protein